MSSPTVEPLNFVSGVGSDGQTYVVRPVEWTLEKVDEYYEKFKPHRILSDDMPQGREGFEQFVLASGALWFELVMLGEDCNCDSKCVGILYVADFVQSMTTQRFLSASFHMSLWDSKVSPRLPVLRKFVQEIFRCFNLHRLEMEIPLFAGGAIRLAKKSGFVEEGVRRFARRYNGQWWNVLHLAMLKGEVPNG